jgi:class 3 adenylate cyclase
LILLQVALTRASDKSGAWSLRTANGVTASGLRGPHRKGMAGLALRGRMRPRADDLFGPRVWGAPLWPRDASNASLAAVLAADVAGYSRLMGADEEGSLARPKGPST